MKKMLIVLVLVAATLGMALGQGLTIWTDMTEQQLEWLEGESASFSAAFGVPVNVVKLDFGEFEASVLRAAPQGEAGDVFVGVPHDRIGGLAASGVLADLSAYATPAYLADLSEQARLAYTVSGKLFGLPMSVGGPALIVNTDLVPNPPATYEEMIALAQQLTTADTFGFMFAATDPYFGYLYIRTFGGYVFGRDADGNLDPRDVGLNSEGAIRGAQALKDLRYEYGLLPAGVNYDVANGLFIDGSLAMIYNGPWATGPYLNAGVNFAVMPVPPMADGTQFSGFMDVQGVLVNQFSPNKVNAANYAKWLTRPAAQISLAPVGGRIPVSAVALEAVGDDPLIQGFGAALYSAEPMPNIPEMGRYWGPAGSALEVILASPDSDIVAVLNDAVRAILGD